METSQLRRAGLKITICAALLATLCNPISWTDPWLAVGVQLALMLAVTVGVAMIESLIARQRLRAIPRYNGLAGASGLAALVLAAAHRGGAL